MRGLSWQDVAVAAELIATAPHLIGGVWLRAWPGEPRACFSQWVRSLLPEGVRAVDLPLAISDDRLLGGVALAETLRLGRVVSEQGLLVGANGSVIFAAMAERMESRVSSELCAALDGGELSVAREGLSGKHAARFGVVALDEGIDDEIAPASLRDRLAIHLDLEQLDHKRPLSVAPDQARVERARQALQKTIITSAAAEALCEAAMELGILSLRAPLLAIAVARTHAALFGRARVEQEDIAVAARLVLGPRATRMPQASAESESQEAEGEDDTADEPPPPQPPEQSAEQPAEQDASDDRVVSVPEEGIVVQSEKSALVSGLLSMAQITMTDRRSPHTSGKSGVVNAAAKKGRRAGVRAGELRQEDTLNVVETLRAAAPWQTVRKRERAGPGAAPARIEIRRSDFRINRMKQKTETRVIFVVDASGSSALQRLAEAKGAVEQVLLDCYARRDHVALIAFSGERAALLLQPTRSLVKVRRSLAELTGGGATPLAAGIDAALALALDGRRRGQAPVVVLMTDGRANMARTPGQGRAVAAEDAAKAARAVAEAGVAALFLDTSPRARPEARELATLMGARYLPLPYVGGPSGISRAVRSIAGAQS